MSKLIISASILNADFSNLEKEIQKAVDSHEVEWIHYDIMDGNFVPNISFGPYLVSCVSHKHHLVNDIHIMVSNPRNYIDDCINSGADYLTFHYEACKSKKEVFEFIDLIHKKGAKAGLSIKPNTPIDVIYQFLGSLDLVLIMSVEPGFGCQKFNKNTLGKIYALKDYIVNNNYHTLVEVDGGINEITAEECRDCGIDVIVTGSYLYHSDNFNEAVKKIRG